MIKTAILPNIRKPLVIPNNYISPPNNRQFSWLHLQANQSPSYNSEPTRYCSVQHIKLINKSHGSH